MTPSLLALAFIAIFVIVVLVKGALIVPQKSEVIIERLGKFSRKLEEHLAEDAGNRLAYLAPSRVNLELTQERWPNIVFHATREHAVTL